MRLPWTRRAQEREAEARRHAERAEQQLRQVRAQWPKTWRTASETRDHRLDGWTETVKTIFGGQP
jgi:hypothetical protein